jgi:hypothetical protein
MEKTARKRRMGRDLGGTSGDEENEEAEPEFGIGDATLAAGVEPEDADAEGC